MGLCCSTGVTSTTRACALGGGRRPRGDRRGRSGRRPRPDRRCRPGGGRGGAPVAGDAVLTARRAAYEVVRRTFEQGAYADRAFAAVGDALAPRERRQAMRL